MASFYRTSGMGSLGQTDWPKKMADQLLRATFPVPLQGTVQVTSGIPIIGDWAYRSNDGPELIKIGGFPRFLPYLWNGDVPHVVFKRLNGPAAGHVQYLDLKDFDAQGWKKVSPSSRSRLESYGWGLFGKVKTPIDYDAFVASNKGSKTAYDDAVKSASRGEYDWAISDLTNAVNNTRVALTEATFLYAAGIFTMDMIGRIQRSGVEFMGKAHTALQDAKRRKNNPFTSALLDAYNGYAGVIASVMAAVSSNKENGLKVIKNLFNAVEANQEIVRKFDHIIQNIVASGGSAEYLEKVRDQFEVEGIIFANAASQGRKIALDSGLEIEELYSAMDGLGDGGASATTIIVSTIIATLISSVIMGVITYFQGKILGAEQLQLQKDQGFTHSRVGFAQQQLARDQAAGLVDKMSPTELTQLEKKYRDSLGEMVEGLQKLDDPALKKQIQEITSQLEKTSDQVHGDKVVPAGGDPGNSEPNEVKPPRMEKKPGMITKKSSNILIPIIGIGVFWGAWYWWSEKAR